MTIIFTIVSYFKSPNPNKWLTIGNSFHSLYALLFRLKHLWSSWSNECSMCRSNKTKKELISVKNVKMKAICKQIHYYLIHYTQTTCIYLTLISSTAFTKILKITNQEKGFFVMMASWVASKFMHPWPESHFGYFIVLLDYLYIYF